MGIKRHLGALRPGAPAFPSDTGSGSRLASRRVFSRNSSGHLSVASAFASLKPSKKTIKHAKVFLSATAKLSPWMPTKLNGDRMAPGCFAAGRSCLSVGHWLKAGLAGGFQQKFRRVSLSIASFASLKLNNICAKTVKSNQTVRKERLSQGAQVTCGFSCRGAGCGAGSFGFCLLMTHVHTQSSACLICGGRSSHGLKCSAQKNIKEILG